MKTQPLNTEALSLRLDRKDAHYLPGDALQATFEMPSGFLVELRGVEASVVWHTAGKGGEDLHVHHFRRYMMDKREPTDEFDQEDNDFADGRLTIHCDLPTSPLSYDGRIVKVCWCVRVRLIPRKGKPVLVEAPLRLGEIAPAPAIKQAAAMGGRR